MKKEPLLWSSTILISQLVATNLIAMPEGSVIYSGRPEEIVSPEMVQNVFDLRTVVISDPITSSPLVIPHPTREL